jgi:flagellar hook-associated protein 3 FlgL
MVSRVSTGQYFDNSTNQLTNLQNSLSKTETQLSTSLNIVNPSDAPDKASLVNRLNTQIAQQGDYNTTLQTLQTGLQTQDTALQNVSSVLTRMKELMTQAANDTTSVSDRATISQQLTQLRDQVLSIANTKDSDGSYIFAGSKVGTAPFAPNAAGVIDYQGDQQRNVVPVGNSLSLQVNTPGSDAFVRVDRSDGKGGTIGVGFFQSLGDAITAVKNSDQPNMQRALGEINQLTLGVSSADAKVGTTMQTATTQASILNETTVTLKSTLSNVQDLDYTTAITKMNKDELALQAAQSTFAKISQQSLFKYIQG